jgi:hypothetical protein
MISARILLRIMNFLTINFGTKIIFSMYAAEARSTARLVHPNWLFTAVQAIVVMASEQSSL